MLFLLIRKVSGVNYYAAFTTFASTTASTSAFRQPQPNRRKKTLSKQLEERCKHIREHNHTLAQSRLCSTTLKRNLANSITTTHDHNQTHFPQSGCLDFKFSIKKKVQRGLAVLSLPHIHNVGYIKTEAIFLYQSRRKQERGSGEGNYRRRREK